MSAKILRLRAVKDWTGLSRSTIYVLMKRGEFPQNFPLGTSVKSVGWNSNDIQSWIDDRIATKNSLI